MKNFKHFLLASFLVVLFSNIIAFAGEKGGTPTPKQPDGVVRSVDCFVIYRFPGIEPIRHSCESYDFLMADAVLSYWDEFWR